MTDQPAITDHAARAAALEQELVATRAQMTSRLVQSELKAEAIRLGIVDLDLLKLVETASLKLTDDGTVPEATATLARLKAEKPWMFTNASSSNPAPTPRAEPAKPKMAKDMTHKEWQAAREKLIRAR